MKRVKLLRATMPALAAALLSAASPAPAQSADTAPAATTNTATVAAEPEHNPDEIRLNFRGVPISMVLDYLSEAAGFTINLEATPQGTVDLWSARPVSRDEAFNLLNAALLKNGLAALRRDRTLTIINRDEAKTRGLPVKQGSDPNLIPDNEELVTQILPVKFVEAAQVLINLQPLVSAQTMMTANESANAIVVTDTQSNIRKVAEVIQAIDAGSETVTQLRVFKLKFADPIETADMLTQLFPDERQQGNNNAQAPQMGGFPFPGGGGFAGMAAMAAPRGGFPGGGGPNAGDTAGGSTRIKQGQRVLAVPDARTSSIAVSAPRELFDQIAEVITRLDADPAKKQKMHVFALKNASPQEVTAVLQDIFQKNGTTASSSNTRQNQTDALQQRMQNQILLQGNGANVFNSGGGGFGGGQTSGFGGAGR